MNIIIYIFLFLIFSCSSCGQNSETLYHKNAINNIDTALINPDGKNILTRFSPPKSYKRSEFKKNSFAWYLRTLPLKPHNSKVKYYNNEIKPNYDVYDAVVDLKIGKKDLHQCADAVMRLRAEYLWNNKKYNQIHFNFTNGFRVDYNKWMEGNRVVVKGNKTYWSKLAKPENTYQSFWNYMEIIFSYAGTYSLSKELKSVSIDKLSIGDIFIQGGFPGHAIIVVDMAINNKTGEKLFLLAQSYMPAQEIQILKNPNNKDISPWYSSNFNNELNTPEWGFTKSDLKRFEE